MKFWFLKNEKLVDALTEFEREFPILNMYMEGPVTIFADIAILQGERAVYILEDYFFNEAGGEADKLNKFLGEGWKIGTICANFVPKDPRVLFIKQED